MYVEAEAEIAAAKREVGEVTDYSLDNRELVLYWKIKFTEGKLYLRSMYFQRAIEEFEALEKWARQFDASSIVNTPKYQSALFSKMA